MLRGVWAPKGGADETRGLEAQLATLLSDLDKIADDAKTATTQEDRALLYGRILSTCHRCHGLMGVTVEQ
jgi:cytochrome c553